MVSRLSQSSVTVVTNEDDDARMSITIEHVASSYGDVTTTSMAYLPQTLVLCDLRHDASEALAPRWRLKERVSSCSFSSSIN